MLAATGRLRTAMIDLKHHHAVYVIVLSAEAGIAITCCFYILLFLPESLLKVGCLQQHRAIQSD